MLHSGRVKHCRTHLQSESGNAAERFAGGKNLANHRVGIANQVRTVRAAQRFELCPRSGSPTPFAANVGHHVFPSREESILCCFIGIAHETKCVYSNLQSFRRMTGAKPGLSIQVDQRTEVLEAAANDGHHEWQAEKSCANKGFWRAANADPDRYRILQRPGEYSLALKGRPKPSFPIDLRVIAQAEQ